MQSNTAAQISTIAAKPILKWAGGKTQMLGELFPKVPSSYGRYIEPFFGGGALFFALQPENAVIADSNPELINMYRQVADHVDNVISYLEKYQNTSEMFYSVRSLDWETLPKAEAAARTIYLNRTCYNGLYGDDIEYLGTQYPDLSREKLKEVYSNIEKDILGQSNCKKQIISGMYRLIAKANNKPVVLMIYGPSGVGKTESAKSISKTMGGELLRIQFSMMQTTEAYNYVFGAEHSKGSFARDMMARESNVILIDEFDKVNPAFYNAFYELFDEGRYVDTNYDVNLGQAIFLLTCNFGSEEEIKKILGPAMFSRIGCCIAYEELSTEQKQTIVHNWYESILSVLKADEKEEIEKTDILDWFIKNAERYDNIRILKTKLENAIFDRLSEVFIIS